MEGENLNNAGEYRNRKKKRDIKPTVPINIKATIYRLSDITKTPIKDVAEYITALVIRDRKAIEHLKPYFKRNYIFENIMIMGSISNKSLVKRNNEEPGERVTIRFKQQDYAMISDLSHALDCTKSRTVAVCLEIGISNLRFVNAYIKNNLRKELTNEQMRELQGILKYVSETGRPNLSWAHLLSLVDEAVGPRANISESVNEFLIKNWRDQS